ncbi:MAG: glycosyltransferase family 39 protein [Planctomycetaceae bacterium]
MPAPKTTKLALPSTADSSQPWFPWLSTIIGLFGLLMMVAARGDLWFDEILSVKFAHLARNPMDVLLAIPHDNNHPLNTLFLYYVPDGSPFPVYRLLSVAAGILSLVLAARFARREWGEPEAIGAVVLLGTSYPLLLYFSEARGYAPAICCGLWAYDQLSLRLRTIRWRHVLGFWAASVLGILSQSTFVILSGAFFILQGAEIWRRRGDEQSSWTSLWKVQSVPVLFIGLWWLVFVSRMGFAGGPEYDKLVVIQEGAALLMGLPNVWPYPLAALGIVLAIIVGGTVSLKRDQNLQWVFYPSVLVLVPAAVILVTQPRYFYFRYLLVSFPFFYLLLAYWGVRLYRGNGALVRGLLCVAAAGMLCGHAMRIVPLLEFGRGRYFAALESMVRDDPGTLVRIGSDHDNRNSLLIEFYAPRLAGGKTLEYVPQPRLAQTPPEWFLTHSQDLHHVPELELRLPAAGTYRLTHSARYAGVSGWAWYVYRREASGEARSHQQSP